MKCIVFAMEKEAKPLLENPLLSIKKEKQFGFTKINECSVNGKDFIVAISGIGKAFAASAITSIANNYPEVDQIINAGVGGSNNKDLANILNCVISTKLYEHDLDTTPIGDPYGMISGINIIEIPSDTDLQKELGSAAKKANCKVVYAPISSGDQFISVAEQRKKIASHFDSLCYDMESAPMGQIAYVYKIKFSALRIISDCADSAEDYEKNLPHATGLLSKILINLF